MYYNIDLERIFTLEPEFLNKNYIERLKIKIYEIEGTCFGKYGIITQIVNINKIDLGKIQDITGNIEFKVNFRAITFKPLIDELLDGIVTNVNKMGFFALVGPIQVFVPVNCIPNYMVFDYHSNCFLSEKNVNKIEKESKVRLKITSFHIEERNIFSIGSINEKFLGIVD